ncbi:hypothetical protein GBAR_LOCUS29301, partial [Geodia barretti]
MNLDSPQSMLLGQLRTDDSVGVFSAALRENGPDEWAHVIIVPLRGVLPSTVV